MAAPRGPRAACHVRGASPRIARQFETSGPLGGADQNILPLGPRRQHLFLPFFDVALRETRRAIRIKGRDPLAIGLAAARGTGGQDVRVPEAAWPRLIGAAKQAIVLGKSLVSLGAQEVTSSKRARATVEGPPGVRLTRVLNELTGANGVNMRTRGCAVRGDVCQDDIGGRGIQGELIRPVLILVLLRDTHWSNL